MKHYYIKLTEAERDSLLDRLEGNRIQSIDRAIDELNIDSIRIKLRVALPQLLGIIKLKRSIEDEARLADFRRQEMMRNTSSFTATAQIATNE